MRRCRRTLRQNGPVDKERAFQILFREKTYASVWHWLDRLGVPVRDRRDVSQDVFLAAHQSFHTYDPMRSRPERWLNKITVHVAAHYRDRARHRREELAAEEVLNVVHESPGADEQIGREQGRLEVLDTLQGLDVDLRSVLIAHDIDGIPMAEIAELYGIPLSTAYKWRARARLALREVLEQRCKEARCGAGRAPAGAGRSTSGAAGRGSGRREGAGGGQRHRGADRRAGNLTPGCAGDLFAGCVR